MAPPALWLKNLDRQVDIPPQQLELETQPLDLGVCEVPRRYVDAVSGGETDKPPVVGDLGDQCSSRPYARPEIPSRQRGAAVADIVEQTLVIEI